VTTCTLPNPSALPGTALSARPVGAGESGQHQHEFDQCVAASREGYFQLPPSYYICGGTSCATPVASAAAGLLISAAKQKGMKWDEARLRYAL